MTDLFAKLTQEGWRQNNNGLRRDGDSLFCQREQRVGLPACECNKKPPPIVINRASWDGHPWSYEVELTGERNGIWLKLMAYSLRSEEEVRQGIEMVKNAWSSQVSGDKP